MLCFILFFLTFLSLLRYYCQGGVAFNIVPAELSATFDIRLPPSTDFKVTSFN